MKFLIVAGTPVFPLPCLGISLQSSSEKFTIDGFTIAGILNKDDNDITLLYVGDIPNGTEFANPERIKHFKCSSYFELQSKLKYLVSEVEYDSVGVMLHMPRFESVTMHALTETAYDGSVSIEPISDDELHKHKTFIMKVSSSGDETSTYIDLIHGLADNTHHTNIVCLEHVPGDPQAGSISGELIEDRMTSTSINRPTGIILDACFDNPHMRNICIVGKNGAKKITPDRAVEYVKSLMLEAGELSRERRAPQTEEVASSDV